MKKHDVFRVWSSILRGYAPFLSIEITKECPLRCRGCYAYSPDHLGPGVVLDQLSDLRGRELIDGVLGTVRRFQPLHVSIVGGEPLVRYRELDELLPRLDRMGIEVQLVTSAVRPIPPAWARIPGLHLVVSIDGLQPEHDQRRAPATYERVLKHIAGHAITVHCTASRPMLARETYLEDFARLWSERPEVHRIWFSIYTPQRGDRSGERLTHADRVRLLDELPRLGRKFPKVYAPDAVINGYRNPPHSPAECVFAQVTACVSADLTTPVTPCQFGGDPVCEECGCIASAGMTAAARTRLAGLVTVGEIFSASQRLGRWFAKVA